MPKNGTGYADNAQLEIEKRLRKIYQDAQKELIKKLDEHTKRLNAMDKVKRQQLEDGQITETQYKSWLRGQMFTGEQWKHKVDSLSETMLHANEQANAIIEGKRRAVFGKNYLYQARKISNDLNMGISFDLYDSSTVTRLLRDQPELLPRRKVDKEKDFAWNRENIANAVTQGIIQGDSIPALARRIAEKTAFHNRKATERYARTAMTGAQNAGRMEMLHEAQEMGIGVKKVWLATLDSRTRDAHAKLDGQEAEVDEPFKSEFGDIMYPGDPAANPANTWNCRCTLIYKYDKYPMQNATRYDQENEEVIDFNDERASQKVEQKKEPEKQKDENILEDLFGDLWSGKTSEDNLFEEEGKPEKNSEDAQRLGQYGIKEDDYPPDIQLTAYDRERLEAIEHYYDDNYKISNKLAPIHDDELRLANGDDSMFSIEHSKADRQAQEKRKANAQAEIEQKKEQGYKGATREESYKKWKTLSKELAFADEFEALELKNSAAVGKRGIQYWQKERTAAEREIKRVDFTEKLYRRLLFSKRGKGWS
jgi:SPP1 gp7 family putative phage head morphogenesis protein